MLALIHAGLLGLLLALHFLRRQAGDDVGDDAGDVDCGPRPGVTHDVADPRLAPRAAARSLKDLRAKTKNSLHLAAVLLQDRRLQIQARIVMHTLRPLREEHEHTIRQQRTPEGTLAYHVGVATESWLQAVHGTLALLADPVVLKSLGLYADTDTGDLAEETAESFFHAVFEVVAQRCLSMTVFSTLPPWRFAGLLQADPAACAELLDNLEESLSHLRAACLAADKKDVKAGAVLADLLKDLDVHCWPAVAQMLTLLEAEEWRVTEPVRKTLVRLFGGKGNTKTNLEDCFNKMRDTERAVKNRRLSRTARYFTAAAHAAATEGDRAIQITPADWSAPPRLELPPSKVGGGIFQPSPFRRVGKSGGQRGDGAQAGPSQTKARYAGGGLHSSLDLHDLFSSRREQVSSGPAADHRATAAWECLHAVAPGGFHGVDVVWTTTALIPRHIYRVTGHGYAETFVVLAFRKWAALTWPLRETAGDDGTTYFRLMSAASPEWRILRPDTVEELTRVGDGIPRAVPYRVVLPAALPANLRNWGVQLAQDGEEMAVLPYAVLQDGRHMLLKHLKGFCQGLGLRPQRGAKQTKAAYLKLLIDHLFEDWSAEDRQALLRKHLAPTAVEAYDAELLQAVEALEPEERQHFEDLRGRMELVAAIAEDVGQKPARPRGGRGTRVNVTPAHLRELIPQNVPGCCLVETLTPVQRYQGFYPGAQPRWSCARQWGGQGASAHRTQKEALDEVVKWLWWAHKHFGPKVSDTAASQPRPAGPRGGEGRGRRAPAEPLRQRGRKRGGAAANVGPEPRPRRRRTAA